MPSRTRKVEAVQAEPVPSVTVQGAPSEELIETRFRMLDVTARQAVVDLQILRGRHRSRLDQLAQTGCVPFQGRDRDVTDAIALGRPRGVPKMKRSRLEDDAHHVLALGSE